MPPTTWGRASKAMQGLRTKASKPGDSDRGEPLADGVIREWLVLSPPPAGGRVDQDILPDEAPLAPEENGKIGEAAWKKVTLDGSWLDFRQLFGADAKGIGWAAANV